MPYKKRIDTYLESLLNPQGRIPHRLYEAMHYSVLRGGKRFRAELVYRIGEFFHASKEILDPLAAAVEICHAFSLVHDDMPCIDNDDLRHGKPTTHKAFDESTALLAGDSLLLYAFSIISQLAVEPEKRLWMLQKTSFHLGATGLCGGEYDDVMASDQTLSLDALISIYKRKTGALLSLCSLLPYAAGTTFCPQKAQHLEDFGYYLGIAYQLQDDSLDFHPDPAIKGRTPQSDQKNRKTTLYDLLGEDKAVRQVQEYMLLAHQCLKNFRGIDDILEPFLEKILTRRQ
jgi:farnesyl diphosphate synthase